MNRNSIWTCKDGRKVRVRDMEDRHLLNTIAMLERQAPVALAQEAGAAYSCAASLQGEMAQYYADQDIDRMEHMTPEEFLEQRMPIYEVLVAEKERRKL